MPDAPPILVMVFTFPVIECTFPLISCDHVTLGKIRCMLRVESTHTYSVG